METIEEDEEPSNGLREGRSGLGDRDWVTTELTARVVDLEDEVEEANGRIRGLGTSL